MAYKFQFGDTTLSGSTTFEESLIGGSTISASTDLAGRALLLAPGTMAGRGAIGIVGDTDLLTLTANTVTVAGAAKATTLSASSTLSVEGASTYGPGALASISAAGIISGSGLSTLSGLAADVVVAQSVDINGGAIDGAIIGANSAVAGTFTTVTGTNISGSGTLQALGIVTLGNGKTTISVEGVLSSSADATITKIDADELVTEKLTVTNTFGATTLSASLGLTGSSLEIYAEGGGTPFFSAQNGILSGSGLSTLSGLAADVVVAQSVDINGGAIDGAIIGANSAVAGTFTTVTGTNISGSGTLQTMGIVTLGNGKTTVSVEGVLSSSAAATVEGAWSFGKGAQTTVSAVGVLSSSATATLANATMNRITAPTLVGNMTGSGGLDLMGPASFGNARLVVNENIILGTTNLHVSGNFFKERVLDATDVAANQSRIAYFDMKAGEMKTTDFKVYADVLAGTGITATAGVLSVDTTGGDSMTSKVINYIQAANDGYILQAGMNFFVDTVTGSTNLQMPSGSSGDIVIVKTAIGVSTTNYVKVSSSMANANQLDGFSEARIESAYGAVSFVYTQSGGATGDWVIY
jgi:hypothetical protein